MDEPLQKQKIVVIDDSEINRAILADILSEEYEVLEACDGVEGLDVIRRHEEEICVVLLDIVMPEMDGFETLAAINACGWSDRIPVVMISAESSSDFMDRAYDLGAVDYIPRPFDSKTVIHRVRNTIMLFARQRLLQDMVAEQIYEKEKTSSMMVEILSNIVEFRNGESGLHVLHIRTFTEILLRRMAEKRVDLHLTSERIHLVSMASALHDIGKIAIDDKILNKPGRLTKEEFEIIKTHSAIGADMLRKVPLRQDEDLLKVGYAICRWHHERYDGRGYPDGLKGDEIPIEAQVVAMADVYDALTSERVYKAAYPHEQAMTMIANGECGAFNPLLLECLKDVGDTLKKEIGDASAGQRERKEASERAQKLPISEETPMQNHALKLLEQERVRNQFLESISREVSYEYDCNAKLIIFSPWSAEFLGVERLIHNPLEDERLKNLLGEDKLHEICEKIAATTPEDPMYIADYRLNVSGSVGWYRLFARSLWGGEHGRELEGSLGKFLDINHDYEKMDKLEKLAATDRLTGLYNHATARKLLEQRFGTVKAGRHLGILVFDLDRFKAANDRYGHLHGDRVLQKVAVWLKENTRAADITARTGGDEFLVIMEYSGSFEPLAGRLFRGLSEACKDSEVSVSMGAAVWPDDGETYEELFHAADQAMYASKRDGGDRLSFYRADTMSGMLSEEEKE